MGWTSSAASWQHRQKQVSLRCTLVVLLMKVSIIVPKLSRGGGAIGVQQHYLLSCICHGSPLILTFYTHVRVLLELAVGKRKRVSPEMAGQFSIAMQIYI